MATIAPVGRYYIYDDNGAPLSGGKVHTYDAGTTTPKATYTTQDESTANTNPVVLDADGGADIWFGDGGYKLLVTDSADVEVFTTDNLGGSSSTAFSGTVNAISSNTPITDLYANSSNIVSAAVTLSLLPASTAGEGFYFNVKNTSTGIVTIDPDAAETIDGSATLDIGAGLSALIICNGTTWYSLFLDVPLDINGLTQANITATDELIYADVSDSNNNKKDTVQGVVDLAQDVSSLTTATVAAGDLVMINDIDDSNAPKQVTAESIAQLSSFDAQSPAYDSGNQTYTAGGRLDLTHSLAYTPLLWKSYLVCTTAEDGFSIGDIIELGNWTYTQASTASYNYITSVNATAFEVNMGSSGLLAINNDSSTVVALTAANFKIRVIAY